MKISTPVLIILDSLKYVDKETSLKASLADACEPEFYYSYYENSLVRFFHKTPFIGNFLAHIAYWTISLNAALKLLIFFGRYKKKIFINPIVGIFYCLLSRLCFKNENLIVAGFLFENKNSAIYFALRKFFVKICYKKVFTLVVYSKYEIELYSGWFPSLASKFEFVKYGRDYDFFTDTPFLADSNYVSSGGGSNRDFKTLVSAFSLLKNTKPMLYCKIATRPNVYQRDETVDNVDIYYDIRLEKFGSFLNSSLFVIIPLKNTLLSAGHMALLEAMYLGKIILITDIASVRDYVNDELVVFYKPEDPYDMAAKIVEINTYLNDEKYIGKAKLAQQYYYENYTFQSLLKRIVSFALN